MLRKLVYELITAWEKEFDIIDHKEEEEESTLVYMNTESEVVGSSSSLTYGHFRRLREVLKENCDAQYGEPVWPDRQGADDD
jgi:hypothetical protein